VWALRIVLTAPTFDEDLCLMQRIEEFPVQQLIPQLLGDPQFATGLGAPDAFAGFNFHCPQMSNDVFRRIPFPCHAPSFRRLES